MCLIERSRVEAVVCSTLLLTPHREGEGEGGRGGEREREREHVCS